MNHASGVIDPSLRLNVGDLVMVRVQGEDESPYGRTDWYRNLLGREAMSPEDPFKVTEVINIEDRCTCGTGMAPQKQHAKHCAVFDHIWWLECGQRIQTIRTLSVPIPDDANRDAEGRQWGPGQASMAKKWTQEAAEARRARQEELLPQSSTTTGRELQGTVLPDVLPVTWFAWEKETHVSHGRSGGTNFIEELHNRTVVLTLPVFKKDGHLVWEPSDHAFMTASGISVAEVMMDACEPHKVPLIVVCQMASPFWDLITPSMPSGIADHRSRNTPCGRYQPGIKFMEAFGVLQRTGYLCMQRSGLFLVMRKSAKYIIKQAWIPSDPLELPTKETLRSLLSP